MSNSVRPHRRQPTRLHCPWDSPGKNTGVGCHFLLQCLKVKSLSRVRPSATPWTAAFQAPPSMGFSRQEYWSGVPLPSPNHGVNINYLARLILLGSRLQAYNTFTRQTILRTQRSAAKSWPSPGGRTFSRTCRI